MIGQHTIVRRHKLTHAAHREADPRARARHGPPGGVDDREPNEGEIPPVADNGGPVGGELEPLGVNRGAAALEIPPNTAYSRLCHARKEFEAALTRQRVHAGRRGPA